MTDRLRTKVEVRKISPSGGAPKDTIASFSTMEEATAYIEAEKLTNVEPVRVMQVRLF